MRGTGRWFINSWEYKGFLYSLQQPRLARRGEAGAWWKNTRWVRAELGRRLSLQQDVEPGEQGDVRKVAASGAMRQQLAAGLPGAAWGSGARAPGKGDGPAACCPAAHSGDRQRERKWPEPRAPGGAGGGVWRTDLERRSAAALPPAARQGALWPPSARRPGRQLGAASGLSRWSAW